MPILFYDPNAGESRGRLPNASNPLVIGGIRFMPGTNQVSQQDWDVLNTHPAYQKAIATRLEMGKLRLIASPVKDAEPSICDYNLTQAKQMIESCTDVDLLKRWQSEDSRKGAQTAIAEQLKKLLPVVEADSDNTPAPVPVELENDIPVFS